MSDPKARILARRGAFIAAAFAAACDRCDKPQPCLAAQVIDSEAPVPVPTPVICLSVAVQLDAGAPEDAGRKEGGGVTLGTIDITVDAGSKPPPSPMPCLSVVVPPPTVCLKMAPKKSE